MWPCASLSQAVRLPRVFSARLFDCARPTRLGCPSSQGPRHEGAGPYLACHGACRSAQGLPIRGGEPPGPRPPTLGVCPSRCGAQGGGRAARFLLHPSRLSASPILAAFTCRASLLLARPRPWAARVCHKGSEVYSFGRRLENRLARPRPEQCQRITGQARIPQSRPSIGKTDVLSGVPPYSAGSLQRVAAALRCAHRPGPRLGPPPLLGRASSPRCRLRCTDPSRPGRALGSGSPRSPRPPRRPRLPQAGRAREAGCGRRIELYPVSPACCLRRRWPGLGADSQGAIPPAETQDGWGPVWCV